MALEEAGSGLHRVDNCACHRRHVFQRMWAREGEIASPRRPRRWLD